MLDPHAIASLGFRFSPLFRALLGLLGYDPEPEIPAIQPSGGIAAPMRIKRKNTLFKPIKPIPLPIHPHIAHRKEEELFLLCL